MNIPQINEDVALLLVDLQNDFLPGGTLAVNNGDKVIPFINSIMQYYDTIIATRDWHPKDHISFANNHEGHEVGDIVLTHGIIDQILWPEHCVQGTLGAELSDKLNSEHIQLIFDKGDNSKRECYSAFFDRLMGPTGLDKILKEKNIKTIHVCGLATDYCVKHTACDALNLGYTVYLYSQGIQGVNLHPTDSEEAIKFMIDRGIKII